KNFARQQAHAQKQGPSAHHPFQKTAPAHILHLDHRSLRKQYPKIGTISYCACSIVPPIRNVSYPDARKYEYAGRRVVAHWPRQAARETQDPGRETPADSRARPSGRRWKKHAFSAFGPRSKRTPQVHELTQMVSVVVGKQERFSQNGLPVAVRNALVQIGPRVPDQLYHGGQLA